MIAKHRRSKVYVRPYPDPAPNPTLHTCPNCHFSPIQVDRGVRSCPKCKFHNDANPECPACKKFRTHTKREMKEFHPMAGNGYVHEVGWTYGKNGNGNGKAKVEETA